jgi:hypothetical protein
MKRLQNLSDKAQCLNQVAIWFLRGIEFPLFLCENDTNSMRTTMSGLLEPSVKIEIEIQNQEKKGEACPVATGDVAVNLENREKAIEKANYGPMNPNESNMDYWREISRAWRIAPAQAKKSRCGNCAAFIQTPKMLSCIESGLDDNEMDAWEVIDAGDLGYCEMFDFKCASKRTCEAWISGGPITEDSEMAKEDDMSEGE